MKNIEIVQEFALDVAVTCITAPPIQLVLSEPLYVRHLFLLF